MDNPIRLTEMLLMRNKHIFHNENGYCYKHLRLPVYYCINPAESQTLYVVHHHWQQSMPVADGIAYVHQLQAFYMAVVGEPVITDINPTTDQHKIKDYYTKR